MQGKNFRKQMSYLFCGTMTTIVNMGLFSVLVYGLNLDSVTANIFSWLFSVSYSYLANKTIVYCNFRWITSTTLWEMLRFFLSRAVSGCVETTGIFLLCDVFMLAPIPSKVILSVIVLLLNYLSAEKLVFYKNKL